MHDKIKNGLVGIIAAGAFLLPYEGNGADGSVNKNPETIRNEHTLSNKIYNLKRYNLKIDNKNSPNFTPGRKANIEGIIIHSSEGSGQSALNWLLSKESRASSHYLVIENGSVYQLVEDKDTAWQAGKKANPSYIGIELAGFANKPRFKFTDNQYENSALLVSQLIKKYNLKRESVVSHGWITKNLGGTDHTDPDPNFDWKKFNEIIKKYASQDINIEVKKK